MGRGMSWQFLRVGVLEREHSRCKAESVRSHSDKPTVQVKWGFVKMTASASRTRMLSHRQTMLRELQETPDGAGVSAKGCFPDSGTLETAFQ